MDNYNYDIYFNKNYHDDVYNNGNYFDAIYLGNKLWWKKQSKIILGEISSIIEYNSTIYCLASFKSDDWADENSSHQRYYISEIKGYTITPLFNVTPENIYAQRVVLREIGETGFLLVYIKTGKGTLQEDSLFSTVVPMEKNDRLFYPFNKTSEKMPDFTCSYLVKIDESHVEKRVSDGSNYYRQTYISQTGNESGYHVISKWNPENNEMIDSYTLHNSYSISNLIQSAQVGTNIADYPLLVRESNIYFKGIYGSPHIDCFYLYGDLSPTAGLEKSANSIKNDLYNSVNLNKPYICINDIIYMYGTYYNEENKYIDCIYSFDGTSISIEKTMRERISESSISLNKFEDIYLIGNNITNQTSFSSEKYSIKIIKGDTQKNIEIAPKKYFSNFCGFIDNEECISFFIRMIVNYGEFKIGMNLVNINKDTLEIESVENISIDTQYIE